MQFVGVDLASQPAGDDLIVDRAHAADAIGLDCPFGWPAPFVETIRRHHDGEPTGDIAATPRDLRLRTADQWIRRHIPRDPLSASTDRLGIVALRGIGILERLAEAGADRLIENGDDLDAVIAALVAGLAHAGHTTGPPPEHTAVAMIEGWIHVPTVSLDQVAAVHFAGR